MKKFRYINGRILLSILITFLMLLSSCQFANKTSASNTSSNTITNINVTSSSSGGTLQLSSTDFTAEGTAVKASTIALNNNIIYYCNPEDNNKIYTMNSSDASKSQSSTTQQAKKLSEDTARELIVTADTIYYVNGSDSDRIYSMNLDGTNKKKVMDVRAHDLVMVGNCIYYIEDSDMLSVFDPSSGKKFSFGIRTKCFTSDGSNIYYETSDLGGSSAIYSMKINGAVNTKVCDDYPTSIAADSGNIYYADGNETNSLCSMISGKRNKINELKCSDITIDNGYIYYLNNSDFEKIYKVKTDGTGNAAVCDNNYIKSFIISGNAIYFNRTIDMQGIIYTANK